MNVNFAFSMMWYQIEWNQINVIITIHLCDYWSLRSYYICFISGVTMMRNQSNPWKPLNTICADIWIQQNGSKMCVDFKSFIVSKPPKLGVKLRISFLSNYCSFDSNEIWVVQKNISSYKNLLVFDQFQLLFDQTNIVKTTRNSIQMQ